VAGVVDKTIGAVRRDSAVNRASPARGREWGNKITGQIVKVIEEENVYPVIIVPKN
jgi:hypothetical protein